jgi:hypothetical protein
VAVIRIFQGIQGPSEDYCVETLLFDELCFSAVAGSDGVPKESCGTGSADAGNASKDRNGDF